MAATPVEWAKQLTPIAKSWLAIAVITTIGSQFGFIDLDYLSFDLQPIYSQFQIWRFVTTFFYFGKLGFPFLMQMFIVTRYTQLLESEHFKDASGLAEIVFLLLFGGTVLIVLNCLFFRGKIQFLASALSFVLLYVWSRKAPHAPVSSWGLKFEAWHLPFIMLIFTFILGTSPKLDICGIIVGHLYHFLMDIAPKVYNKQFISCPMVLYRIFGGNYASTTVWRGATGHRLN
eukprot:42146_1